MYPNHNIYDLHAYHLTQFMPLCRYTAKPRVFEPISLSGPPLIAEQFLKAWCLVRRPFILLRHILNELFFMLLRIKSITEASVKPYSKRIISKGVRSSHAISIKRDRSASVRCAVRSTTLTRHPSRYYGLDHKFFRRPKSLLITHNTYFHIRTSWSRCLSHFEQRGDADLQISAQHPKR